MAALERRDEWAMRLALDQALNAELAGEVPVGAVILHEVDGALQVLATGYNRPVTTHDPSAHAEIVALRHAAQLKANYRLPSCTLYVTLEPCAMCAMALLHARVGQVVFGAGDPKTGAAGSVLNLFGFSQLNHQTSVRGGVLEQACGEQLRRFFSERRRQKKLARDVEKMDRPGPTAVDAPEAADAPIPTGEAIEGGEWPVRAESPPES